MAASLNTYLHNPELPGEAFNRQGTRGDAVLLLHGFTATSYEVYRLGKVLNNAGFTTCGPMLPGHGTRPADLNKVRWQDWIAAAETAYQSLAQTHRRVFVGGESNGALVALYLAAQHPEIAGVLAYAPALIVPMTFWQRVELRLVAPFVPSLPKTDLDGDKSWQGYKVTPLKAVIQLTALQKATRQCLPAIHQPILVVQGRHDKTIDPHSAEVVYNRVSSTVKELHWMEHSGHCVLLDAENHLVTKLTMDFLWKVIAQPAG